MCAVLGAGLEGCVQYWELDLRGVCGTGSWIRGVCAVLGAGLEGCVWYWELD